MAYESLGMGATAVGLRVGDIVVLGSEKRFGYGGFVMSRSAKKVFKIHDKIAVAAAGIFADMLTLSRIISTEIRYYEISSGSRISVKGAAKLLSAILYSYKYMPFITELIVGGVDDEGAHVFVMDPLGSLIEDDYAAVGTGAPIAIGIIESEYQGLVSSQKTSRQEELVENAVNLVVKAIRAAAARDAMSGDGVDVAIVRSNGVEERTYPIR
ncbi:proteasome endopeptidase complex, beta subunit [Desulfurococcaceae archaeon AG1]|nr:proteasome endopeptidase complex, beta subunit [Desulfurococcaceae archaeon AG1]